VSQAHAHDQLQPCGRFAIGAVGRPVSQDGIGPGRGAFEDVAGRRAAGREGLAGSEDMAARGTHEDRSWLAVTSSLWV
jgi:hypothetical protein